MIIRILTYAITLYLGHHRFGLSYVRDYNSQMYVYEPPESSSIPIFINILLIIFVFLAGIPSYLLGNKKIRNRLSNLNLYVNIPFFLIFLVSYLVLGFWGLMSYAGFTAEKDLTIAIYDLPYLLAICTFLSIDVYRLGRHTRLRYKRRGI